MAKHFCASSRPHMCRAGAWNGSDALSVAGPLPARCNSCEAPGSKPSLDHVINLWVMTPSTTPFEKDTDTWGPQPCDPSPRLPMRRPRHRTPEAHALYRPRCPPRVRGPAEMNGAACAAGEEAGPGRRAFPPAGPLSTVHPHPLHAAALAHQHSSTTATSPRRPGHH